MKKMSKRIAAGLAAAVVTFSLTASAFAAGPGGENGPQGMRNRPEMGQQQNMSAPMDGMQTPGGNAPSFGQDKSERPEMSGNQPPMGEAASPQNEDPMSGILDAVNSMEDADAKDSIQSLLDAHLAAIEAEHNATDDSARTEAAKAVAAAQDALNAALTEAGIEAQLSTPEELPNQSNRPTSEDRDQLPEKPQNEDSNGPSAMPAGTDAPANGEERLELPAANLSELSDEQAQNLFQAFLQWLKGLGNETEGK